MELNLGGTKKIVGNGTIKTISENIESMRIHFEKGYRNRNFLLGFAQNGYGHGISAL